MLLKAGVVYDVPVALGTMSVKVVLSGEVCHTLLPLLPASVMMEVAPAHIVPGLAVAVPPMDGARQYKSLCQRPRPKVAARILLLA